MDDKRIYACSRYRLDERLKMLIVIMIIDANTGFDGHRQIGRLPHRRDELGHERRLFHQAGTEAPGLHPVTGATHVQIDLIIAPLLTEPRPVSDVLGLTASQLQCHRILCRMSGQKPFRPGMPECLGGHHFGIEQRVVEIRRNR